jgi:hypothetical protein
VLWCLLVTRRLAFASVCTCEALPLAFKQLPITFCRAVRRAFPDQQPRILLCVARQLFAPLPFERPWLILSCQWYLSVSPLLCACVPGGLSRGCCLKHRALCLVWLCPGSPCCEGWSQSRCLHFMPPFSAFSPKDCLSTSCARLGVENLLVLVFGWPVRTMWAM